MTILTNGEIYKGLGPWMEHAEQQRQGLKPGLVDSKLCAPNPYALLLYDQNAIQDMTASSPCMPAFLSLLTLSPDMLGSLYKAYQQTTTAILTGLEICNHYKNIINGSRVDWSMRHECGLHGFVFSEHTLLCLKLYPLFPTQESKFECASVYKSPGYRSNPETFPTY